MKSLYKHDFSEDLSVEVSLGAGKVSVAAQFSAAKELDKLAVKLEGKSDLFSKIAGYAIGFAKDYIAKAE